MIIEHITPPAGSPFAAHNVVPIGVKLLADTETPVSVLERFQRTERNLFLLESAEGDEKRGRFSFLGLDARRTFTVYHDRVVMRDTAKSTTREVMHNGDPMDVLRKEIAGYRYAGIHGLPSTCAGIAGYFAYEMVSFWEKRVENKLPHDKAMAELMMPGSLLVFDNVKCAMYVISLAFEEDGETALSDANARVLRLLEILADPAPSAKVRREPLPPIQPTHGPEYFKGMVEACKEHVKAGDLIQCVPSQSFVTNAPRDPVALYRMARYVNPSPYLYYFKLDGCTLVGSSPETMIKLEDGNACLRPIAGTRPRGATEEEDRANAASLLADEKECAEHLMLVDLGRNELGRVSEPGTVKVADLMVIERYSHVMHIVSRVVSRIEKGFDAFDLFKASFPAGTLSGAPKVRAMQLIAELEDEPRGPYGGAVGYFAFGGDMDFAICIRTCVIQDGKTFVRAGAGIVYDSQPDYEYRETVNKAGALAKSVVLLGSLQSLDEEIANLREKGGVQ